MKTDIGQNTCLPNASKSALGFHRKASGSYRGFCGCVAYDLHGYDTDEVLMIGFASNYTGDSHAYCAIMDKASWSKADHDKRHSWVND